MKVVHIIRSIIKINFGVWNAALSGSQAVKNFYNIDSEVLICNFHPNQDVQPNIPFQYLDPSLHKRKKEFQDFISKYPKDTVIVTHGSWFVSTKLGYWAALIGYKWVYTPHGMLEPWTFKIKRFQKLLYFPLYEGRYVKYASSIRAVSYLEKSNLIKLFPKSKVTMIPNCVSVPISHNERPLDQTIKVLFMGRLNPVKNVDMLVKAWHKSSLNKNMELTIAGPDENVIDKVNDLVCGNIKYVGPQYGPEKERLLQTSHYFILPSSNEGMPSSIIEAMSYGIIPIFTDACNLSEVLDLKIGIRINPVEDSISHALEYISEQTFDIARSKRAMNYVRENLSDTVVAKSLRDLYLSL